MLTLLSFLHITQYHCLIVYTADVICNHCHLAGCTNYLKPNTVLFQITDNSSYLPGTIKAGTTDDPDLVLDMKDETFFALIGGSTSTAAAYMTGEILRYFEGILQFCVCTNLYYIVCLNLSKLF